MQPSDSHLPPIVQSAPHRRTVASRFRELLREAPQLEPIPLAELGNNLAEFQAPAPAPGITFQGLGVLSNPKAFIDHLVLEHEESRGHRFDDGIIHPSGLHDFCDRQFVLLQRHDGPLTPPPRDPDTLRIFHLGHSVHRMYQEDYFGRDPHFRGIWLCAACIRAGLSGDPTSRQFAERFSGCACCGAEGTLLYQEIPIEIPGTGIKGRVDGVFALTSDVDFDQETPPPHEEEEWVCNLDMKSARSWAYRAVEKSGKPPAKYITQQQTYMEGLRQTYPQASNLETTLLLYINKDTSEEMFVKLERDPNYLKPYLKKACNTWDCINDPKKPLPKRKKCRKRNSALKRCPLEIVDLCFSLDGK